MTDADKQALIEAGVPIEGYSIEQWREDMEKMQPRFIDTYVIPPFMMWYAWKSKPMGRWPRRLLFTGGLFALYRNWSKYRESAQKLSAMIQSKEQGTQSPEV